MLTNKDKIEELGFIIKGLNVINESTSRIIQALEIMTDSINNLQSNLSEEVNAGDDHE